MDANSGPVWGAARRTGAFTTTATVETFLWASSPFVSLRHTSDPATLGLAPGPVTEEHTSEPEGVRQHPFPLSSILPALTLIQNSPPR